MKFLTAIALALLLGACASTPPNDGTPVQKKSTCPGWSYWSAGNFTGLQCK